MSDQLTLTPAGLALYCILWLFSVSSLYGNGHFQHVYYPGTVSTETGRFHWMPAGDNISIMENEIWKPVKGYENSHILSNSGKVKSIERSFLCGSFTKTKKERLLIPTKNGSGYMITCLDYNGSRKIFSMHRLIAIHFIENPDNKPIVNHINGIRHDNRICNLEWSTYSENNYHTYKLDKHKSRGENNGQAKLSENQVRDIITRFIGGEKRKDLAAEFGMSYNGIYDITIGRNWQRLYLALTGKPLEGSPGKWDALKDSGLDEPFEGPLQTE